MSGKLTLNIDEDVFSDVYWKICDIKSRYRVIWGGGASSKSYSVAQDELIKGMESKQKTLVIRKVEKTIKESVFASFKARLNEFNLQGYYRYTASPAKIFLANGTEFLFAGLDDPEKIKSIDGITRIVVEEASELLIGDFFELDRRLRGFDNMQITLLFNPIDEDHWLKTHFFDQHVDDLTTVHVTYHDNQFAKDADKEVLERYKYFDENDYKIYALGQWGKIKTGSEFFPRFSKVQHTGEVKYLPHLGIHQSWDFNYLPYQPMCCFQIAENVKRWEHKIMLKDAKGNDIPTIQRFKEPHPGAKEIYVTQVRAFKEYTFAPPINDVDNVCKAYIEHFGRIQRDLFIYGDASGKSNVPGHGDGANFKRIKKNLSLFLNQASDRVNISNPSVMKSRDFMNKVFSNWYPIEFIIDKDNCPNMIKDLESVLLSKDGMLKEIVKDKKTGVSYQKNGHLSDLTRYLFTKVFSDLFKANI